jgi:hypothetical protein
VAGGRGWREHLDSPEGETKARRTEHKLLTVILDI